MNFGLNYIEIQKGIKQVFKNCFKNHPLFSKFKLKILNKTQINIGAMTINNVINDNIIFKEEYTKKCNTLNCKCCPYIAEESFIQLKEFYLHTDSKANCNTLNGIYAIRCKLCKKTFYIGESERKISARIREHQRAIINFVPLIKYNTVVGHHFNLKGHNWLRDFQFYILSNNHPDMKLRQTIENSYVHLFKHLGFTVINEKVKSKYLYGQKI